MLKIATDSSADIPDGWIEEYDINVIPININFNGISYQQGVDLDPSNFYRLVNETQTIPKTSLPSPQQIMAFYQKIASIGDTILSIHVSSKLSGTVSMVQAAARNLEEYYNVIPFDSLSGSVMMAFMCKEARMMDRKGAAIQDILARLETIRRQITIIFTVDNLEYARLSGRVNALQSALTSLLQIKPIIILKDGLIGVAEKVRTRNRSLDRILEIVRERLGDRNINIAVVHAHDPETGLSVVERVKKMFNYNDLVLADLSISVASHLGPKTIGIVAYPVDEG